MTCGKPLRDLLISAIRYGEQPEVWAYLTTVVEQAMDREKLQRLIEDKVLDPTIMDASKVQRVREDFLTYRPSSFQRWNVAIGPG
jgi:hypothetical protein